LEDLSLDGRVILKWKLQKQGVEWTGFIWLSVGKTEWLFCFEHRKELSDSIKREEFLA
jgi:hypothetical protein